MFSPPPKKKIVKSWTASSLLASTGLWRARNPAKKRFYYRQVVKKGFGQRDLGQSQTNNQERLFNE